MNREERDELRATAIAFRRRGVPMALGGATVLGLLDALDASQAENERLRVLLDGATEATREARVSPVPEEEEK